MWSAQVIGMSATMGRLDAVCAWLRCRLFMTNFRPVPLAEHAVFQGTVFRKVLPPCSVIAGLVAGHSWVYRGHEQCKQLLGTSGNFYQPFCG